MEQRERWSFLGTESNNSLTDQITHMPYLYLREHFMVDIVILEYG